MKYIVKSMAFINDLREFFSLITLPTLVGVAVYFGRKFQVLDNLDRTMTVVKDNIKIISNALVVSGNVEWDGTLLKDYSPLNLTEEGKQYLEQTGFIQVFNDHQQAFLAVIEHEKPNTKYDVENLAVKSVFLNADADFMQPVKEFLYNHPKDNLPALAKVASVVIRDTYLASHPEIAG